MKTENKFYGTIGDTLCSCVLENGLRVFVIPKPEFRLSFAMLAVNYGGAMRRFSLDGKARSTPAGVAHYLEHKMFDMPDGSNVMARFSAMGASPNAFTSAGMTAYHFDTTRSFGDCLRLLLEYVSTPYFTPESVAAEQGIIGQEICMIEDSPSYAVYKQLLRCLYRHHPIRDTVAGSVGSIAEIDENVLYDCHRAFYRPSNMALCVEGNVNPEEIADTASEILPGGSLPPPVPDYGESEDLLPAELSASKKMDVSAPQFLIGCKGDGSLRGEEALRSALVASLAMTILMGRSSPFYTKLYEEGLLRGNFSCEADYAAGTATFMAGGESPDPPAVLERLRETAASVGRNGISADVFERCRRAEYGMRLRDAENFGEMCSELAEGCFAGFNPLDSFELLQRITADECADWIRGHFAGERLAISIVS